MSRPMSQRISSFSDLFALSWGFAAQRTLATATRTGIIRHLAEGSDTPEGTAASLGLDAFAVGKVVRALHALGVAEVDGASYRLNPNLRPLFRPGDQDVAAFLAHSDMLNDFWGETLEGWVRTGEHPRRVRDAEGQRKFGAAMKAIASHLAPRVAEELDLHSARRYLDVGGGIGYWATVFCRAEPGLYATVLEHPEVAALGQAAVAGTGLEARIEFRGGSYTDADLGEGWDLVLLANIIHQERSEGAARLVQRAACALAPGGRLAVVDFRIDDERRRDLIGVLFAINMRGFGDTYPEPVIRDWMARAGLEPLPRVDLAPAHWLITGRRRL